MQQIQTLSTPVGRSLLRDIFRELRYEKQLSGFTVLSVCWRLCVFERDIYRFSSQEATVLHPLGFFTGTSVWLREIVNRFYYSTINSLVYLGAAALLVIVGVNRFTQALGDDIVVIALTFEALMLTLMFVVMFFSPIEEDGVETPSESAEPNAEVAELIREIGEISRDYAGFAAQVDEITSSLSALLARQDELIASVNEVSKLAAQTVAPQPELLQTMGQTNAAFREFNDSVNALAASTKALRKEQIEQAVRKEVERILAQRVSDV